MTMEQIVDIAFHIDRFRTYDLLPQGTYRMKVSIRHQKSEEKITYAKPYLIPEKKFIKKVPYTGNLPSIVLEDSTFTSRSFYIKYCDQIFEMNDICLFRFKFPAFPLNKREIIIKITLCSLNISQDVKKKRKNIDKDNFYELCSTELRMQDITNITHQYFPVFFENYFFSTTDCMLHAYPVNFGFSHISDKETIIKRLDNPSLSAGEKLYCRLQLAQDHEEFIKIASFPDDSNELSPIFSENYPKLLARTLRDLLMFIERLIALFDSNKKTVDKEIKAGMEVICANLINEVYEFSPLLTTMEINHESLSAGKREELKMYQNLMDACPNISDSLKVGLLKCLYIGEKDVLNMLGGDIKKYIEYSIDSMGRISGMLQCFFFRLIDLCFLTRTFYIRSESSLFHRRVRERLKQSFFFHEFNTQDLGYPGEFSIGEFHCNVANSQRDNKYYQKLARVESVGVEDISLFPKADQHPIVFEEKYILEGAESVPEIPHEVDKPHLIIFLHGYEGSSFDMKPIKNFLSYFLPGNVYLHCATSNDVDTTEEIDKLGIKLANEVNDLIKQNFSDSKLYRLSFVGHSLGGLIIRAALPRLLKYSDIFYTFISFGTPHLGCTSNQNMLVKTGLRLISKFTGYKSLNQMNLSDANTVKDSYMFKLSEYQGLEFFRNVLLFSSYQDYYAPFESARIEYGDIENKDRKNGFLIKKMAQNILNRIRAINFIRVDLNFKLGNNFGNLIGREAHIQILENGNLQLMLAHFFRKYLE